MPWQRPSKTPHGTGCITMHARVHVLWLSSAALCCAALRGPRRCTAGKPAQPLWPMKAMADAVPVPERFMVRSMPWRAGQRTPEGLVHDCSGLRQAPTHACRE